MARSKAFLRQTSSRKPHVSRPVFALLKMVNFAWCVLPLIWPSSLLFSIRGSYHLYWKYSVSKVLSYSGIAFWRDRGLFQITKYCHLKYSVEWRNLDGKDLIESSWSGPPSCPCSFKFSKRSNPKTQDFSPKPLKLVTDKCQNPV